MMNLPKQLEKKNPKWSENRALLSNWTRKSIFIIGRSHLNHRLLGEDGLPRILTQSKKLKFKGKGREREDLDKLLNFYQIWGHDLFPKLQFKSFVEKLERVCKEKRLRASFEGISNLQVFHSAVIEESRKRQKNEYVDEEELETRILPGSSIEEELDLDKELEQAIRARQERKMSCFNGF